MTMKKILILFGSLLLLAALVGYSLYNKPHRNASGEAYVSIQAAELFNLFETNEAQANENYLDKIIEVHGVVSAASVNQQGTKVLILESTDPMFGVSCTLANTKIDFHPGDNVRLKGFCKGYLSDVVLTDCVVVKHQAAAK